mmetsp:Transcript_8073/g.12631  ORF Transcript_8073/g.12631 Transcript_8073/m.12631 type:complete len:336 (-) Transcript_8073:25-1032(-)
MASNTTIEITKSETKMIDEEDTVIEEDDYSSEDGSEDDGLDIVQVNFRASMSRGMSTSALFGRKASPSSLSPSRRDLLSTGNSVANMSKPTPSRGISRAASERRLPVPEINDSNMTHLRRKQREENAELWELLRQSKARVEQQNNILEKEAKTDSKTSKIEETFEQENRELFDLLQQSKKRLDDAVSKAEQEKAANDKLKANPYMDLHILPEINEDEAITDADLTTKELLTAMAVAEEAALSGKDTFETPAKEVLRGRDYSSFSFLMEEEIDDQQSKETLLIQEERNNCRAIYNVLTKRWDEFEKRATLRMFSLVRQTSKRLFYGFSAQKEIEVE